MARFPEYQAQINLIVPVVVALALVGGYTLQDTAAAWGTRPDGLADILRALLEEFIGAGAGSKAATGDGTLKIPPGDKT